jgi:methylated-DNA-[protein]-cysteine S-methyltransferase
MDHSVQSYHVFETANGFCGVAWNAVGITCFRLPTASADAVERLLLRWTPRAEPRSPAGKVVDVVTAAKQYFEGEETDFSFVKIDLGTQQPFFVAIYDTVRRIGWGQTTTYGAIAKSLGAGPETARDVGQAMAKNPVPLIIPCHRVLAAGGRIGGFSAPAGSTAKARMLELEGFVVPHPKAQQQAFGF